MLTNTDFAKFKKIFRETIEAESENVKDLVSSEIKMAGLKVASQLQEVNSRLKNQEIRLIKIEKDIKKLRSDLTTTINFFDNQSLTLKRGLQETRSDLNLAQLEFI